jgi:hypothetical protein
MIILNITRGNKADTVINMANVTTPATDAFISMIVRFPYLSVIKPKTGTIIVANKYGIATINLALCCDSIESLLYLYLIYFLNFTSFSIGNHIQCN